MSTAIVCVAWSSKGPPVAGADGAARVEKEQFRNLEQRASNSYGVNW